MDWSNPVDRHDLLDRVGPDEYHRLQQAHRDASIIDTVNGHALRPVSTRFGRLIIVGDTGLAFSTEEQARKQALTIPPPK